jgi:hypothetical protein
MVGKMSFVKQNISVLFLFILTSIVYSQSQNIQLNSLEYKIYPDVNDSKPDLPSPFITKDNQEFVIAFTKEKKYAIIPVTLSNDHGMCKQLVVDTVDFPYLAKTGLHLEEDLNDISTITNRSLEEITKLGKPNGLSQAGFMASDENIISVIKSDNLIVSQIGLKHPQMAKPLFHVLNMMDIDLSLNRWNMARHKWENIQHFFYNNQKVFVEAEDTKGGQKSIFNDNIQGAFYIRIWRELEDWETKFLQERYKQLTPSEFNKFKSLLTNMNSGEIEPQYIMRYGFYEGHTYWRTDPIAIAFIFGLKTLPELESIFENELYQTLTGHFTQM